MPRRVAVLLQDVCFAEDGTPRIRAHVTPTTSTSPSLQSLPSPRASSFESSDTNSQCSYSHSSSEGAPIAPIQSLSSNTSYHSCNSAASDSLDPPTLQDRLYDLTIRLQAMHATSLAKWEVLKPKQATESSFARRLDSEATARHSVHTKSAFLFLSGCASSSAAPAEASEEQRTI